MFSCTAVVLLLCLICDNCFAVIPFQVIAVVSALLLHVIAVITVVSVLLFHALAVIPFQVFNCYELLCCCSVILFHVLICFTVLLILYLRLYLKKSKFQIFFTYFPKNIISVTFTIQTVQIYQDFD